MIYSVSRHPNGSVFSSMPTSEHAEIPAEPCGVRIWQLYLPPSPPLPLHFSSPALSSPHMESMSPHLTTLLPDTCPEFWAASCLSLPGASLAHLQAHLDWVLNWLLGWASPDCHCHLCSMLLDQAGWACQKYHYEVLFKMSGVYSNKTSNLISTNDVKIWVKTTPWRNLGCCAVIATSDPKYVIHIQLQLLKLFK